MKDLKENEISFFPFALYGFFCYKYNSLKKLDLFAVVFLREFKKSVLLKQQEMLMLIVSTEILEKICFILWFNASFFW